MKSILRSFLFATLSLMLVGITSCSEDEATISELILGTWDYQEDQTNYSAGLALQLSGYGTVLDTATVLGTVSTLFNNSEITFASDKKGSLNKDVVSSITGSSNWLSSLLGDVVKNAAGVNFTYVVSDGKVTLTLGGKEYKLKVYSISESELVVAMEVADLSSMISEMFGSSVGTKLTQSEIFQKLDALSGKLLGITTNPTVRMTFVKKK